MDEFGLGWEIKLTQFFPAILHQTDVEGSCTAMPIVEKIKKGKDKKSKVNNAN